LWLSLNSKPSVSVRLVGRSYFVLGVRMGVKTMGCVGYGADRAARRRASKLAQGHRVSARNFTFVLYP
jgi:hypothetical protein